MTDIRHFTGFAPTHCCICGARWAEGCVAPCVNAPQGAHPAESGPREVERSGASLPKSSSKGIEVEP